MSISIEFQPDFSKVKKLLQECNLPTSDITNDHMKHFFHYSEDGELKGVIGIEPYSDIALLRSLAVHPAAQKSGIGQGLVTFVEEHSRQNGIGKLFLLTTTAELFFTRMGYSVCQRSEAPESIKGSAEFSSICPSSSIFMAKRLR
jgi:amino-acid N-acetyltransferase